MGALAQALIAKGYNPTDAANAENGPRAAELAKEYGVGAPTDTSSSGGGVDSILNTAIDSVTGTLKTIPSNDQANPFSFDTALATQASTAEYSPYYQQLLTDYTSGVERTKARSAEDLQSTLTQLAAGKEYYTGTERRLLDRTLDQTNKGYAGQGLFFSGANEKDKQQILTEYGAQTGEYNRQYGYNVGQANLANTRTNEDITTASSQYSRDVNQAKTTAIQQGVLQRQSEAIQQYEVGRSNYYANNSGVTYA